ncbi:hypothetical protein [Streptomyces sp. SAJ15]|uniref:hypothetical protein n=1 Tax=Streptomyces sp. SAJ15 TaxID=2011095 RepID=UPI0021B3524C|nr:hypothetical protein [Streptomyces sp. SAJ15]
MTRRRRRARQTRRREAAADAPRGLAQLETYVYCQGEIGNARKEAEAFARGMPWLTAAQHEEVVRRFAKARLELSRTLLRELAQRRDDLGREYADRYEALQGRLKSLCAGVLISVSFLATGIALVMTLR